MEGGDALLADPSLIARNYREAVRRYFVELDEVVRTTGVDYQRVRLHESYEQALVRFSWRGFNFIRSYDVSPAAVLMALPLAALRW